MVTRRFLEGVGPNNDGEGALSLTARCRLWVFEMGRGGEREFCISASSSSSLMLTSGGERLFDRDKSGEQIRV